MTCHRDTISSRGTQVPEIASLASIEPVATRYIYLPCKKYCCVYGISKSIICAIHYIQNLKMSWRYEPGFFV